MKPYVLSALVIAAPYVGAQAPESPMASPQRTTLERSSALVPLKKIGDFFFADVSVNGRPFLFTLETGGSFSAVSPRLVAQLGLTVDSVEVMPGLRSPLVRIDSISFGGATLYGIVARVQPSFEGRDEDGLISMPMLRPFMWTMDLSGRRLVLQRGALPEPDGRDILPLPGRDRGRRVDLPMAIGGDTIFAVLDTRYAGGLMVSDSLLPRLQLASPLRYAGTAWGPSQGSFEMRGARLNSVVAVGRYTFPRAAVVFRDRPGPIVGVGFLEEFVVTVDHENQRIRLTRERPIVEVPAQSWEYGPAGGSGSAAAGADRVRVAGAPLRSGDRTFGFRLAVRPNSELTIVQLAPGSAAEQAGIREGDNVVEFDGVPAASMTPQIFRAALARDAAVKVVVRRGDHSLEFNVVAFLIP